jgi:iron complex outermembrane recepter protein
MCVLIPFRAVRAAQTSTGGTGELTGLSLEQLGDIEVTTASKEPESLRRTPAAVYVITQEDIQRYGATSIPEILRLAPGVDVARIDSDHWSIGIRGFGDQFSKAVLVLIDGRNVYTPLFAGIVWGVQDTLIADIDRIEVIRGPGGTIWGANAVNGVINIITKNAADTQGVLASAGAGTIDREAGGLRYGGTRGKAFAYRVYGKGFNREPERHDGSPPFDDWHMAQSGFRTDWSGPRDTLTVQGDAYKGLEGQSVGVGVYSPPSQLISYDPLDLSGGNLLALWRRRFTGGSDLRLQAYYDRTSLLGPQIGETRNTADVDLVNRLAGLPRQDITWGAGAHISPSRITQTVPTLSVMPARFDDSIYSAFVQDEVTLLDKRLWLTAGSKVERNPYTGFENQPNVRLLWTPTARQSVWTAVTSAVRTPSRLEEGLQLTGFLSAAPPAPLFVRVVGDPDFQAERLLGYEGGYRSALSDQFYVEVSVFHNRHAGLESLGALSVVVEPAPAPLHALLQFPYANGVDATSDGIEVLPDWKPSRWFQLKGSYSYLDIDAHNVPGNKDTSAVATYEGSSPRHQAAIQPLLTLPRGWTIDQTYRYVSALPARQVAAYGTFDARIGWRIRRTLDISLTGQNLAHAYHVEFAHDPGPPVAISRSAYATITWNP